VCKVYLESNTFSPFTFHSVAELRRTERADKDALKAVEVPHKVERKQVEASLFT
jgi:hypothetical protein